MPSLPFDSQQVFDQMNRMIISPLFRQSNILCDFLKYIVTETLQGRSSHLKEYTVGVNALVKKGFNPQSDASVRIHAGRLRKLLAQYYQSLGVNDTVLISLPKGTYVPVFEIKEKSPVSNEVVYQPFSPTVAVIPFSALDPELDGPIAEGICHQISTDLTAFNEISVVSYYSSRKLAAQETDLRRIGELLDASYMITGSVQTVGKIVRVTVQLMVVNQLHQIWASKYEKDRQMFDSFAIQDDIVRQVINQIAGTHGILVRHSVRIPDDKRLLDVKVYDAVFWYYYLVNGVDKDVYRKILGSVRASVELDKRYALGWAILAETYVAGYFFRYDCEVEDPLREAVRCGQLALHLDAKCHHAYQAMALAYIFLHKKDECIHTVEQWLALDSGMAGIAGGLGFCLICCGEYEHGYRMLNDSIQLNPFYQWWFNAGLSLYYLEKGQWDEAYYWAEKMQHPHMPWALIFMITAKQCKGSFEEAAALRRQLKNYIPDTDLREIVYTFILDPEMCDRLYGSLSASDTAVS